MSSPAPGTTAPCPLLPAGNPRIAGIVNITVVTADKARQLLAPGVPA